MQSLRLGRETHFNINCWQTDGWTNRWMNGWKFGLLCHILLEVNVTKKDETALGFKT